MLPLAPSLDRSAAGLGSAVVSFGEASRAVHFSTNPSTSPTSKSPFKPLNARITSALDTSAFAPECCPWHTAVRIASPALPAQLELRTADYPATDTPNKTTGHASARWGKT